MNVNPKLAAASGALVGLFLLIGWLAGIFNDSIDPTLAPAGAPNVPAAELYVVSRQEVTITESIPATVIARDDTMISSRILARVSSVSVRAGDVVERGQLLVELEQADLRSRRAQARDRITSIEAQLEDARLTLARATDLQGKGLAARADVDSARANYDSLAAQLSSATESLSEAEIVLGYSNIHAPIGGRVVERLAEPGDTVAPGTPILSLYDPLSIRAEAHVREGLALRLSLGQDIDIGLPSLDQTVPGTIEEIVPAADPASRSFLIKANLEFNPALMPGMFARFIIPVDSRELLLVPASAITRVGELDLVHVVTGTAIERRYVRLGRVYTSGTTVTAGLSEGEKVLAHAERYTSSPN